MLKFSHPEDKKKRDVSGACVKKLLKKNPYRLEDISDHFKTQGMCEKAVEKVSRMLEYVPDHLKTQTMCEKAVEDEPDNLEFVPDNLRPKNV